MSIQQKLDKGRGLLNKASNDPDLLGLALTSIHGALEDACRGWLDAPDIKQKHGKDVKNRGEASWQTLLELMPKHCGWSEQDVKYVAKMNSLRNKAAHGEGFAGTREELEMYLDYVEKAIAHNNSYTAASEKTSASKDQYFPSNTYPGIRVAPFRFYIERTHEAVKIYNQKGSSGFAVNLPQTQFTNISEIPKTYWIIFVGLFFLQTILPGLQVIISLLIVAFILSTIWRINQSNILFAGNVIIELGRIHIGKKSYPSPGGTYFRYVPQKNSQLFKIQFFQPNKVVDFGQNLTWHEADELLKISLNSVYMIQDPKSQFSVEVQEGLIFFNGLKNNMAFVVEYDALLWQRISCRMCQTKVVELTESELKELYGRKIQEFNEQYFSQTQSTAEAQQNHAQSVAEQNNTDCCQKDNLAEPRGDDLKMNLKLSSEEALSGTEKLLPNIFCFQRCDACDSKGLIDSGKSCSVCEGTGRIEKSKNLTVTVPAGMVEGTRLRVAGEGDAGIRGASPGDLYIYLHID